jgi:hypothetical protein
MGMRPRREGALPAEVELTAIQCGVYSCVCVFRVCVCVSVYSCVSVSWCRQRRGCASFPGCVASTPRRGVPLQGQCIPPIARARFGAPRRCDILRFLLPLKTAISRKAQRRRAALVASRSTGCRHTRCHRCTMPRFHGTACSEPRFTPEQTSQRYARPTLGVHRTRNVPWICRPCRPWDVRVSSGRDREIGDVRASDF